MCRLKGIALSCCMPTETVNPEGFAQSSSQKKGMEDSEDTFSFISYRRWMAGNVFCPTDKTEDLNS